jgi:uncharacterized damage-inducible protein DinB
VWGRVFDPSRSSGARQGFSLLPRTSRASLGPTGSETRSHMVRSCTQSPCLCLNNVMDLIEHFTRLFAYDAWANQEVLAGLHTAVAPVPRALQLMAHIFAAERLWLARLEQKPQTLPVWPELTIEECDRQAAELPALWKSYLSNRSESDLAEVVTYRNSKGEPWSSRKDDILMHLITHSAYHRGQVALTIRAAGSTPAYTDFIHSIRQGLVK